jgi:hypothetical protein
LMTICKTSEDVLHLGCVGLFNHREGVLTLPFNTRQVVVGVELSAIAGFGTDALIRLSMKSEEADLVSSHFSRREGPAKHPFKEGIGQPRNRQKSDFNAQKPQL